MIMPGTFSIAGHCPRTGMVGVAVCSAVPAVGSICPFAKPGVGAISTQSFVNCLLGIDGLELLGQGLTASEALEQLMAGDPGREGRQVVVADGKGNAAAFTGQECIPWFGQMVGDGYAAAGNMLVDGTTVEAMARAFEDNADDELPERLLKALEAGDATPGDYRGRQSAALLVYYVEEYPYCSLRVDEHRDPVGELRRVIEVGREQLFTWIRTLMPTRANPKGILLADLGNLPPDATLLQKHVDER